MTALGLALPLSIAGTNIVLGVLTAALLWGAMSRDGPDWRWIRSPVVLCLWLYLAAAILTAWTGVSPAHSLRVIHKELHKVWAASLILLACARSRTPRLQQAMLLSFTFLAAYGIAQSAVLNLEATRLHGANWSWVRARGFVHPVTYGEMLGLSLLGGLAFLGRCEPASPSRRPILLFLALGTVAFILNQTRGAFLGLLAGAAALAACERSLRRWWKWALAAALPAIILLEALPTGRSLLPIAQWQALAKPAINMNAQSDRLVPWRAQFDRLVLWRVAVRAFRDHPWLGVGPDNYETVFPKYFSGTLQGQAVWSSAHNLFLEQLAERGLAGFTVLCVFFVTLLHRAWRRAREDPDPWNLWAWSVGVAFLFMNLTETAFQNEQVTTLFLLIMARAEAGRAGASSRSI
ncbi:MAG: O-antigen ligase family protein [Elusimicrobia bacterium]|nr:O-antigen ligase family protein [Elusimicrobiota bacterium]